MRGPRARAPAGVLAAAMCLTAAVAVAASPSDPAPGPLSAPVPESATGAGVCDEAPTVPPGRYTGQVSADVRHWYVDPYDGQSVWDDVHARDTVDLTVAKDGSVNGSVNGRVELRALYDPGQDFEPEGFATEGTGSVTGFPDRLQVTTVARFTQAWPPGNLLQVPPWTVTWTATLTSDSCVGPVHLDLTASPAGETVLDWHTRYGVGPDTWTIDLNDDVDVEHLQEVLAEVDARLASRPEYLLDSEHHAELEAWYRPLLELAEGVECARAHVLEQLVADLTRAMSVVDVEEASRAASQDSLATLAQHMLDLLGPHALSHSRTLDRLGCGPAPPYEPFGPPLRMAADRYMRAHIFIEVYRLLSAHYRLFGTCGLDRATLREVLDETFLALTARYAQATPLDRERLIANALAAEAIAGNCGIDARRTLDWLRDHTSEYADVP